jgi:hypothetical protein
MIQSIVTQNTKYLIPNKEHKNFTDSGNTARVGTIVMGDFKNINGLRRGKPFEYRLFITKDGKILYANCVRAENIPSEILQGADNSQSATLINIKPAEKFKYFAHLIALGGGIAGYYYGKKQNATRNNLIKYIVVGSVGAYSIYWLIDKNKSTTIKPSK